METEITRMDVIVISELVFDPCAINVKAIPKPSAAPRPNRSGLIGSPLTISGPDAQNAPKSAIPIPAI